MVVAVFLNKFSKTLKKKKDLLKNLGGLPSFALKISNTQCFILVHEVYPLEERKVISF